MVIPVKITNLFIGFPPLFFPTRQFLWLIGYNKFYFIKQRRTLLLPYGNRQRQLTPFLAGVLSPRIRNGLNQYPRGICSAL